MRLYATETGQPISIGDEATTFRGERVTVTGWPSTGRNRVWVKGRDGVEREYFPSVINATLKED